MTVDRIQETRRDAAPPAGRHVHLSLPAQAGSVPEARRAVAALITDTPASAERRDDVALAVTEAVTNAVRHAYGESGGTIDLLALLVGSELLLVVGDRGVGLNGAGTSSGLGLGLTLLRSVADQALVAPRDLGGVTVQCRFALAPRSTLATAGARSAPAGA